MTERDKRRARIGRMIGYLDSIDKQDLRDELEASERDREALVDAIELICNSAPLVWVNNPAYSEDAQQWEKRAEAFLKRTEPTDD